MLQAVVMNLQIGCIRSSGHLRQDISSLVSPPCSVRRSIPVTEELNSIAATLIEVCGDHFQTFLNFVQKSILVVILL